MKKNFVNLKNANGRGAYTSVLKKITQDKVCPFCPAHFKYHTRPILRTSKYWLVTENMSPYAGTKKHFLFIHKKHIETPNKLSALAWKELLSHINWVSRKYKLPAGGFFMRFGDTRYTGATVAHPHAQMIFGTKKGKGSFLIGPTLGFGKK